MIGNYDGSILRYFLLISDFIDLFDWKEVENFRTFAASIYPFLGVCSFSQACQNINNFIAHLLQIECKYFSAVAKYRNILTFPEYWTLTFQAFIFI